jgi:hypothetical protein
MNGSLRSFGRPRGQGSMHRAPAPGEVARGQRRARRSRGMLVLESVETGDVCGECALSSSRAFV